ncbi:MAG: Spy/CpxP family protein refolding chaperone [candidate division Zixibacteria bacterium]|nr:Spy/CpxP family protein refolding chaperone [candidate division Zixibacteria bacterium]
MKRTLVATTVTALVLSLALTVWAQRKKVKPEESKMKAELKLSDEQKQKMAAIHRESAKERIRLFAERQIAHIELRELMQADQPDQSAIDRKIDQVAELDRQLTQNRLQSRVASRSVLTKEQWAALKGKMGKRMMKHRLHRMKMFHFKGPGHGIGPEMGPGPGRPMGDESLEWKEEVPEEAGEMEEFEHFGFLPPSGLEEVEAPDFDMDFHSFEADPEFEMEFHPSEPSDEGWQ